MRCAYPSYLLLLVIPAKAGIQRLQAIQRRRHWIPALAGMMVLFSWLLPVNRCALFGYQSLRKRSASGDFQGVIGYNRNRVVEDFLITQFFVNQRRLLISNRKSCLDPSRIQGFLEQWARAVTGIREIEFNVHEVSLSNRGQPSSNSSAPNG